MSVSLQKGQKVSLTKGNPGLSKVVVGLGWDVNQFDTQRQSIQPGGFRILRQSGAPFRQCEASG